MKNKKMLMFGLAVVFLLVLLILSIFSGRTPVSPQNQVQQPPGSQPANRTTTTVRATAHPTVLFPNWSGFTQPASVPNSLNSYQLKQSYTIDEITALARKFQAADTIKQDGDVVTAYTMTQVNGNPTVSFMIFNAVSGEFSYRSNTGIALPGTGTVENKVYALLQSIGWYDPTLKVTATYRNRQKPGVLYAEVHRDWPTAGAAILNPVGLFSIPENQSLAALTLQTNLTSNPVDSNIYATSDRKEGVARSTDFNSATIAIDEKTQMVNMIRSNIRPVVGSPSNSSLISFDQAVEKVKNKEYTFMFTAPSGAGDGVEWDKVYPDNLAQANVAVVTDSLLAYIEESPTVSQSSLEPHYLFKGYANLTSGYRVAFVTAVRAKANVQASAKSFSLVGQVMAQDETSQKQGTFDFGNQQTPVAVTPGTSTPTQNVGICQPGIAELNPLYESGGLQFGWAPYTYWGKDYRTNREGYWYYVPGANVTASIVESNLDNIIAALLQVQAKGTTDIRDERSKILRDVNQNLPGTLLDESSLTPTPQFTVYLNPQEDRGQKQGTFDVPVVTTVPVNPITIVSAAIQHNTGSCPIRLTGSSPSLFLYAAAGSQYNVSLLANATYADPGLVEGGWNVTVRGVNDLVINGTERPYIYYEYEKAEFDRPETGWLVKKADVASWVETIASSLALTSAEKDRVLFEVNHAAADVKADKVFVGLLDQAQVEGAAPLAVSPAPASIYRLHFYVGAAEGSVVTPELTPISRTDSLLLEFGSHSE